MSAFNVLALRVLLVLLLLGTLFSQLWLIPQMAREGAGAFPEIAFIAVPYAAVCIAIVACVQLVIVAMWALLAKVRRGAIFSERAFAWVDIVIGAGAVATVLTIGLQFHLLGVLDVGGPPVGILLVGMTLGGAAFTLLMIVMRGLLRSATMLQGELDEVV